MGCFEKFRNYGKLCAVGLGLSIALASGVVAAPSLVSGVAFFVNGEPVTLIELYRMQQQQKVTQDVAVDRLINQRLHEDEIKKRKIIANDLEVEGEIANIAKQNKTTPGQIRKEIENSGGSWNAYKEEVKKEILKRKLYQSITQEGVKMVDDRELREYYNANKREFLIPKSVSVVKFFSKDNLVIERLIKSGGKNTSGVSQENEVLQLATLNPQVTLAFIRTEVGGFTPIIPIDNGYMTFLVQSKNDPTLLPFDNAKELALQKIMQQKENYVIYEYFEKLRSNAKVDIVRLH